VQTITDILDECPHVLVLFDSVYNFLTYDYRRHHFFTTIGKNWERTITIFSGGKLANATGWKVGWMIAPKNLL